MDNPEIQSFRTDNAEALNSAEHPQHSDAVQGLRALYEAHFPDEDPGLQENPPSKRVDPNDMQAMTQPAESPDAYTFRGVLDAPATVTVEGEDGVQEIEVENSPEFEADARQFLHHLGASPAMGASLERFYVDALRGGFSEKKAEQMYADSERNLIREHGEGWRDALAAANRVYLAAPERIRDMLDASGLSNHPMLIDALVAAARKKGFLK